MERDYRRGLDELLKERKCHECAATGKANCSIHGSDSERTTVILMYDDVEYILYYDANGRLDHVTKYGRPVSISYAQRSPDVFQVDGINFGIFAVIKEINVAIPKRIFFEAPKARKS